MTNLTELHSGWAIAAGPDGLDAHDFDGAAWRWVLEGRGERHEVIVHVPGSALATSRERLPQRVAEAIATHGRSELEWLAALPGRPPQLIDFTAERDQPTMVPPLALAA